MHFYADGTQLYVSFENNAAEKQSTAVTRLNTCIGDVHKWLANNMLKLNDDKTEVILFTSKHALKSHPSVTVTVAEQPIRPATSIRNLGVVYDQTLSMIQHLNSVCRVGYMCNGPTFRGHIQSSRRDNKSLRVYFEYINSNTN